MLAVFKICPLGLNLAVGLQFHVGLHLLETSFDEIRIEIGDKDCIKTFALIFWQNCRKKQIGSLGVLPF